MYDNTCLMLSMFYEFFSEIIVTNISRKSTNTKNITPFNNFLIDNFFINEKYLDSLSPEQVG